MLLSKVVGAILIDIAAAQDAANEYSSRLGSKYKKYVGESNPLSDFQVPNGVLKDVELELKFLIEDLKPDADSHNLIAKTEIFPLFSQEAVKRAIDLLVDFIDRSKGFSEEASKWDKISENVRRQEFSDYLTDKITNSLLQSRTRLIGADRTLNVAEIKRIILEALERYLLAHYDLKEILGANTSAGNVLRDNYQQMLESISKELPDITDISSANLFPGIDIIVGSNRLKEVPSELISSIKLKAEMTNYRWTITQTSATLNQVT